MHSVPLIMYMRNLLFYTIYYKFVLDESSVISMNSIKWSIYIIEQPSLYYLERVKIKHVEKV